MRYSGPAFMRRDEEFFDGRELELVFIAKRLSEAQDLEEKLTTAGVEYFVETDYYVGGFLFRSERAGAFFYVPDDEAEAVRGKIDSWKLRAYRTE